MLLLIHAHGHQIRIVYQNVRRHQYRIGEQAGVHVVGVLGALVLELRHAGELAEHGVAVEHPAELRVGRVVALDEQCDLVRVQAAGDVLGELLHGAAAQIGGYLAHSDGVHVHDAVIGVVVVYHFNPVLYGAHVGAERQIAAGLNAREHYLSFVDFLFFHDLYPLLNFNS